MVNEQLRHATALKRWQSDRGTYHLVEITGEAAEEIAMHERLHRLEFGRRRGFGSVKVMVRIGQTTWKTSVFPQSDKSHWILLIGRKVMRTEGLAPGDELTVAIEML